MAAIARSESLGGSERTLVDQLVLAEVLRPLPKSLVARASLACEVARDSSGVVTLDLIEHGPHAIIGGTTGSGKSELLISWVLAMAAVSSPQRLNFLLVDFKGGSAFDCLAALPHTVGIITDLDHEQATRALASLRAEMRFRERAVAAAGAKSIDTAPELARLVIVVDEFAAMLSEHPDLHGLFGDIAARGRSLGVHLILCTQRPAAAVRDSVLANADLRISLRVNNSADSAAVVGTAQAAEIPPEARGRGVLSLAGEPARLVQFAISHPDDTSTVIERWADAAAPRLPWCPPLPERLDVNQLAPCESGIPFGMLDVPEEQHQQTACYEPERDGHLLVLGAPGSGKSTALATIGAVAPMVRLLPNEVDAAWDVLTELSAQLDRRARATELMLLADDLDSLLARFTAEYRLVFVDRLGRLLRDGPAAGIRLVVAAQRLVGDLQPLAGLIPARLMLRHSSRQEFVVAGGESAQFIAGMPTGGGLWRGHRVQVAQSSAEVGAMTEPLVAKLDPALPLAIVSTRAESCAKKLAAAGIAVTSLAAAADLPALAAETGRTAIVGDVDEWHSRWGALAAVRPFAEVVFEGCSTADFRALTRSRELPPPTQSDPDLCWRLNEDGTASRARLPG